MGVLTGLKPEPVFRYFEEICGIPHISHHEKQLSDYCVTFARERGLFCVQDDMGNVMITAEATPGYEEEEPIMIQGHLDMVGDKTPECSLDLEKEPIKLLVDGDYIWAEGTTLGGDDGIAVAYALAILDAKDIPHPRLEVVFTVCEEVGLLGASAMDVSSCRARRVLNIDSEVEGILTVGCAGGIRTQCRIPVHRREEIGIVCELSLQGLQGGHSGTEIDKGRANANELLGRFLLMLKKEISYGLAEVFGGVKENVIPKNGKAVILVKSRDMDKVKDNLAGFHRAMEAEYGTADPGIRMELSVGQEQTRMVLEEESLDRVLLALNLMPGGVQAMSMDLPGLVETSLNMGIMELAEKELSMNFSIRSSVASAKEKTASKVQLLAEHLGGSVEFRGEYPAWTYARNSRLRDLCVDIFRKQYGHEPQLQALHAGLECGILSGKLEGLDCISFGPNQIDIHTPNEHLEIASVERVWEFLKAILTAK